MPTSAFFTQVEEILRLKKDRFRRKEHRRNVSVDDLTDFRCCYSPRLGLGCLAALRGLRLGPQGLAHRVDLRLAVRQGVHEALVLHDQLPDDLDVVRQRLLLQLDQVLKLKHQIRMGTLVPRQSVYAQNLLVKT